MSRRRAPWLSITFPRLPRVSNHGSEIFLLWSIAFGLLGYMAYANEKGKDVDLAACLVVLTGIISAVKERWTQRTVDRMGYQLGQSQPGGDVPEDAADGADQAADAAKRKADQLGSRTRKEGM